MNYSSFYNMSPLYHPVCSSDFVRPVWLDQLKLKKPTFLYLSDWRLMSLGYFQSLATGCQMAHDTVDYELQLFLERKLSTVRLVSEVTLRNEIDQASKALISSMQTELEETVSILGALFRVNQYYSVSNSNGQIHIDDLDGNGTFSVKRASPSLRLHRSFQVMLLPYGPARLPQEATCYCAFHSECEEPMFIYHDQMQYIVPGFLWRCSPLQSILKSDLRCLYSDRCLTDFLLHHINFSAHAVPVPPLDPTTLIRTHRNSTVSELVDNLFVEEWRSSLAYEKYFERCAAKECQYIYNKRANYVYVVTTLLATVGGLSLSLQLIVPFVMRYLMRYRRHQNERRPSEQPGKV